MRDGKNSIRLKLNFLQNYLHITIGSIKNSPNLIEPYYIEIYQITR